MSGLLPTALALARHDLAVVPLWWPVERNGKLVCACGKPDCRSPAKHPIARHRQGRAADCAQRRAVGHHRNAA